MSRRHRRNEDRRARRRSRHVRRLTVEALEPRLVLSGEGLSSYAQPHPEWFAPVDAGRSHLALRVETSEASATSERWIVRLTPEATAAAGSAAGAVELLSGLSTTVVRGLGLPGQFLIEAGAQAATALAANLSVAYVQRDAPIGAQEIPDDPRFGDQYALVNTGQEGGLAGADIDALDAWSLTTGSSSVVVGVIDSGIDYKHPDLARNVWINQGEIPAGLRDLAAPVHLIDVNADGRFTFMDLNALQNAAFVTDFNANQYIDAEDLLVDPRWIDTIDNEANGKADDLFGWDFHGNDKDPLDEHGHGTHVAGIIGAVGDNARGVAGVNWNVSLMTLRFLDENNAGVTSDAIEAVNYATMMRTQFNEKVRVTNNSWGALGDFNQGLLDAIAASAAADILFVAAAGNGNILGQGIDQDQQPFYPASYAVDNIVTVAATDQRDQLAEFSNFGDQTVDIAAPGVGILSTSPGGQYVSRNGTSMATPLAAGVAALVLAHKPEATALEVRDALLEGADSLAGLRGSVEGGRRLNALGALTAPTFAPRAAAVANSIMASGAQNLAITVTYTDDEGVDLASLGTGDLVVTRAQFAAYQAKPTMISQSGDGSSVTVVYELAAPAGGWTAVENGDYSIILQAGAVEDVNGTRVGQRKIGSFSVAIQDDTVFFVDSPLDTVDANPGDGQAQDAQGRTTLRAAVMEANARSGANSIVLPDGVYAFNRPGANEEFASTGDLDVTDATGKLTIVGGGVKHTTIDANNLDRAFDVKPGAGLDLKTTTITRGSASQGGGVRNAGTVNLITAAVTSSRADQAGGGINNSGAMTVFETTIDGNSTTASFGLGGGGIYNAGTLTIDRSTVSRNTTPAGFTTPGGGGGLFNAEQARADVINSTFSGNHATKGDGGGIYNAGALDMLNDTITENTANGVGGEGGGVYTASNDGVRGQFGYFPPDPSELGDPQGVAVDSEGRIYITDTSNERVQVFDVGGEFLFEFNVSIGPFDVFIPTDIAVAPDGLIYVTSQFSFSDSIRIFDRDGTPIPGFFPHDLEVLGLAVDSAGIVYVTSETEVFATDREGRYLGSVYDGAPDSFFPPYQDVAVDGASNIYVLEASNFPFVDYKIVRIDTNDQITTLIQPGILQAGRLAVDDEGNLHVIQGQQLHVYNSSGALQRILDLELPAADLTITSSGKTVFVGHEGGAVYGSASQPELTFAIPPGDVRGMFASSEGKIYAAYADSVRVFDDQGAVLLKFGEEGNEPGEFDRPEDVAVNSIGEIFVCDTRNNRVQVFNSQGSFLRMLEAPIGGFSLPTGIDIDDQDIIYVADSGNDRVLKYDDGHPSIVVSGVPVRKVAVSTSNGVIYAMSDPSTVIGVDSTGNRINFDISTPVGLLGRFGLWDIEVDEQGVVYVADDRILAFNSTGQFLYEVGATFFSGFTGLALSQSDELVAYSPGANGNDIQILDLSAVKGSIAKVRNTIIAGNSAHSFAQGPDDDVTTDVDGEFTSFGHNLVGVRPLFQANFHGFDLELRDQLAPFGNPGLTDLANYGGPTETHLPLSQSKGGGNLFSSADFNDDARIDAADLVRWGDSFGLLSSAADADNDSDTDGRDFLAWQRQFAKNDNPRIDQLGVARPSDGVVAIGATEYRGGNVLEGEIGGTLFVDINRNGVQDAGEVGVPNGIVFLDLDHNGELDADEPKAVSSQDIAATPEDERGRYRITGLPPGNFEVVQLINGYQQTSPFHIVLDTSLRTLKKVAEFGTPIFDRPGQALGDASLPPSILGDRIIFDSSEASKLLVVDIGGNGAVTTLFDSETEFAPGILRPEHISRVFQSGDHLAFSALDSNSGHGIYVADSQGDLALLANQLTVLPGATAGTFPTSLTIEGLADGVVAFTASFPNSPRAGIYAAAAGGLLTLLADDYNEVIAGALSESQYAVLARFDETYKGIFLGHSPDTLSLLVAPWTNEPSSGATFVFGENDGLELHDEVVTFHAGLSNGGQGLYRAFRTEVERIANTQTPIPGGVGAFTRLGEFHAFSVYENNTAFVGAGSGGQQGIYIDFDGSLQKIVDLNDQIDGKTPVSFQLGQQGMSGHRIAFTVEFDDGSQAIYVAEFDTETFHRVTLGVGDVIEGIDFGARALPGEISGVKYNDLDGDGQQDPNELGLGGWTIYLDGNGNQMLDVGERSTVTGADGTYGFSNLPSLVTYSVAEVPQPGWEQTAPGASASGRWTVTLEAGQTRTGVNFGNRESTGTGGAGSNGRLSGRVTNPSGAPLAGRTVYVDANQNGVRDSQELTRTTNASGDYLFTGLAAGTYTVRVVFPAGETVISPIGNKLTSAQLPVTFDGPQSVAVGQFTDDNGDGLFNDLDFLDMVVANGNGSLAGANNITVLINNGLGLYTQAGVNLPVGFSPTAFAVADFNRDLKPDLAVANLNSSSVSILLGTGNPAAPLGAATARLVTTQPGVNGNGPRSLAAGDFNKDGFVDLAVANYYSGDVTILRGIGGGAFVNPPAILSLGAANGRPYSIVAGQFTDDNNDGLFNQQDFLDLAVAQYTLDRLQLLINKNSSNAIGFDLGAAPKVGDAPRSIAAADFNGDGKPDLAAANLLDNSVSVLLAAGSGTFAPAVPVPAGDGPTAVTAVDVDNDNDVDLLVTNTSSPSNAAVLRNLGQGTFAPAESFGSAAGATSIGFAIVTGRVDNNSTPDVVLVHNSGSNNGRVSVLLNELAGGGHRRKILGDGEAAGLDFRIGAPAPADFDGSGLVDGRDFLHWQRGFGKPAGAVKADGDANADGRVDGTDFESWKSALGPAAVASSGQAAAANVGIDSTGADDSPLAATLPRLDMLVSDFAGAQRRPQQLTANARLRRLAFADWSVPLGANLIKASESAALLTQSQPEDDRGIVDDLLEKRLNWTSLDDIFNLQSPMAAARSSIIE